MNENEFIDALLAEAQRQGYEIEESRNNGRQIIFEHEKKLHEGHLRELFPNILDQGANISALIDSVAPGRPCSHKPMREIIASI